MIFLDTHVVVWLAAGEMSLLSKTAVKLCEKEESVISPMVLLELEYLYEIDRITISAQRLWSRLHDRIGLRICERAFADVVLVARTERWTRDPFDRLIVAQAKLSEAQLLSKDRSLLKHYPRAVW